MTTPKKNAAKKAAPKKQAQRPAETQEPPIQKVGASITHCSIMNNAASVKKPAAKALERASDAVIENAKAIQEIAKALKGAEAHMGYGIHLSDIRADDAE